MRFIPTKVHGVLDYLTGALLIAAPYLLGFADGTAAQWVPMILGAGAILYSLFTNYETGLIKLLPMPVHLMLDLGSGILLAASPWLFGFADRVYWPHLIVGLFEIVAAVTTRTRPHTSGEVAGHVYPTAPAGGVAPGLRLTGGMRLMTQACWPIDHRLVVSQYSSTPMGKIAPETANDSGST